MAETARSIVFSLLPVLVARQFHESTTITGFVLSYHGLLGGIVQVHMPSVWNRCCPSPPPGSHVPRGFSPFPGLLDRAADEAISRRPDSVWRSAGSGDFVLVMVPQPINITLCACHGKVQSKYRSVPNNMCLTLDDRY